MLPAVRPPARSSSFAGKKVLITGAASGIGQACAVELARRGARLALTDVNAAGLENTGELVRACGGGEAITVVADLQDKAAIDSPPLLR